MVSFLESHRRRWSVRKMCRVLEFPDRTYYAARSRPLSNRARAELGHRVAIRGVWENNYQVYGAPRVWRQLQREDYVIARCTVERLMAEMGLRGVRRGKGKRTTFPAVGSARPQDLVRRRFLATRPGELWVSDLTYASSWEGWLYVAFISDVYSRLIVGWQLATHLRATLVTDALEMAISRCSLTGELICHSDAGNHYTSSAYKHLLNQAGIRASIGTVGDSFDNAMAESLNGTYKAELVYPRGPWRTRRQLETASIDWIQWFNHQRLHSSIGYLTPAEKDAAWYRQERSA